MRAVEDPFGTADVVERVLAAWNASPERLREDANAEEDAALGAYRDRLVVELAQNAADAAAAAGVPGRLLLRLVDDPAGGPGRLLAANTGAPLSAEGVGALATLRASAKRDEGGSVGRFGVGFAAVLAVTDAPALRSSTGAVRFSREDSAELVRTRGSAGAQRELRARAGHVPALRLPFPAPLAAPVPEGYETVVELPLRDAAARDLVESALRDLAADAATDAAADVLLLALPGLDEIVVDLPGAPVRAVADVEQRWRVVRRSGRLSAADVAGRGVEDRGRLGWHLTWALPVDGAPGPGVVCAPTPTDEDLPWPALLVATFPLGPDRRRLAPGRATEVLLDAAADAYGDLLAQVAAEGGDALSLLPYGAAAGRVDAELRRRVLDRARDVPLLVCVERVDGAPLAVRPSSAVALTGPGSDDPALLAALAPALAGLVAAGRGTDRLLTELGVTRMGLAEVLDVLPGLDGPGSRALFAALAPLAGDPLAREALSGLPVPLLGGRRVHGVAGVVLPDGDLDVDPETAGLLAGFGLRVAAPEVAAGPARDLLVRLGAREGGAWAVLTDPAVRAAVQASPDADDPDEVAAAVLDVVAAAVGPDGDDEPTDVPSGTAERAARVARELAWLSDLALPDDRDDLAPAGALVLPGTLAERALDPAAVAPVHPDLLREWGPDVLRAVGVLAGPALVEADLDLTDVGTAAEAGLVDVERYVEEVWGEALDALDDPVAGPTVHGAGSVRDLDLVVDAWPEVLAALVADPAGLRALTAPWVVGGHRRPGHLAWWLRRHGPLPAVSRDPAGTAPDWLPPAPAWVGELPASARRALGVLPDLAAAGVDDLEPLLDASAARTPAAADLLALWALLGRSAQDAGRLAPERLAALDADGRVVSADADDVVVPDSPAWAARTDLGPRLLVPHAARVADLLDVDLASDRAEGVLAHPGGTQRPVPAAAHALVPGLPATWTSVPTLTCDGVPVPFWVGADADADHVVATGTAAAADGLAQAAGAWWARGALARLLAGDDPAGVLGGELPGLT
ncbi:sacsin N-terminal ATP-binding-like domain-containing protein [Kineococcus rhizosphaerae]|uniref:Molecular chaperone Hsp90 n=1 Tax=Kineococcus rhizosphaerae TaxID=559628 RepID=A0A2T0R0J3_9ACTN|nr:hypothetical protein [Kineococcus rhizosphaerae]PRY12820.1 hypothetical protein CLV37_1095 [Kineococcus rhizosphaerae]